MLAAFSASVEGPLILPFTRVTFSGMDFNFHEIGMEPRHSWWGVRWFTMTDEVLRLCCHKGIWGTRAGNDGTKF